MMQELRLCQILGADWEKVADYVGLPSHVTRAIRKDNRDVEDCIRSVTEKWIEDAPTLNEYKCTLNGMCRLLIDIGQGAASKHLRQAMEANVSSLKKTGTLIIKYITFFVETNAIIIVWQTRAQIFICIIRQ